MEPGEEVVPIIGVKKHNQEIVFNQLFVIKIYLHTNLHTIIPVLSLAHKLLKTRYLSCYKKD